MTSASDHHPYDRRVIESAWRTMGDSEWPPWSDLIEDHTLGGVLNSLSRLSQAQEAVTIEDVRKDLR